MKDLPAGTRILLFERFYYEFLHRLKKNKGRLVQDKVYDESGRLIKKCTFRYLMDKSNFKKIDELITFYNYDGSTFKRKIHYVIDYKKMTERHTHYDFENDDYYDWKFYFDKNKNLLMSKEYKNKKLIGAHLYYDYKGVRLDKYVFIIAKHLDRALKMDKIELEEFSKPINLMPIPEGEVDVTGYDSEEL